MSSSLQGYHDRWITKRAEVKNFTERINKGSDWCLLQVSRFLQDNQVSQVIMTLLARNTGLVLGLPCSMLLSNRFLIWYDRILNGIKMPRQNKRFSCVQNVFMQCVKRDKNLLFFTLYFSQCTCNIVFSAFFTCDPVCRILLSNNY